MNTTNTPFIVSDWKRYYACTGPAESLINLLMSLNVIRSHPKAPITGGYYRRVGDSIEVVWENTTNRILTPNLLPLGLTIDYSKLPSNWQAQWTPVGMHAIVPILGWNSNT